MKERLINLLTNSYAPYSAYHVSAIVEMCDGKTFDGVNVENMSYGATICAERVAITNAICNGYGKGDFKAIHIMNDTLELGMPCFICRQVFTEFFSEDTLIYVYTKNDQRKYSYNEVCPIPFEGLK